MQARQYSQQQQAMQSAQYYQHQPPPYGPPHGPGYAYTYGQYPPTAGVGGYGAFQGYGPAYGSTSSFSPPHGHPNMVANSVTGASAGTAPPSAAGVAAAAGADVGRMGVYEHGYAPGNYAGTMGAGGAPTTPQGQPMMPPNYMGYM